ncbi:MAG: MarR family transcriptional regulator [Propionibacteriales bacterium]|nr:MarR family transcriptional regulator [Propionibacteriales bacterium]
MSTDRDSRDEPSPHHGRLPFDPIDEAARRWQQRYSETARMHAVTSLMRVHQLVLTELDDLLRPFGLTFARYEVLVLLSFTRRGELPMGKIGERLQVHATSVTSLVKRLVDAGLIERSPHPEDGRTVLAGITARGRSVLAEATDAITSAQFALSTMSPDQCAELSRMLRSPRAEAGDF